jgi:hypothetical protein
VREAEDLKVLRERLAVVDEAEGVRAAGRARIATT